MQNDYTHSEKMEKDIWYYERIQSQADGILRADYKCTSDVMISLLIKLYITTFALKVTNNKTKVDSEISC